MRERGVQYRACFRCRPKVGLTRFRGHLWTCAPMPSPIGPLGRKRSGSSAPKPEPTARPSRSTHHPADPGTEPAHRHRRADAHRQPEPVALPPPAQIPQSLKVRQARLPQPARRISVLDRAAALPGPRCLALPRTRSNMSTDTCAQAACTSPRSRHLGRSSCTSPPNRSTSRRASPGVSGSDGVARMARRRGRGSARQVP